jgi:hypothetical protein
MRKSMLGTLVFLALGLTAVGLARAAGRPTQNPKTSFQSQPQPQTGPPSRIILGSPPAETIHKGTTPTRTAYAAPQKTERGVTAKRRPKPSDDAPHPDGRGGGGA